MKVSLRQQITWRFAMASCYLLLLFCCVHLVQICKLCWVLCEGWCESQASGMLLGLCALSRGSAINISGSSSSRRGSTFREEVWKQFNPVQAQQGPQRTFWIQIQYIIYIIQQFGLNNVAKMEKRAAAQHLPTSKQGPAPRGGLPNRHCLHHFACAL